MTTGIIMAGGRATRLGPLTAQLNKALVSVGQRPIIAHHLELMRNAGVDVVAVVTSPDSESQVQSVIARSHADLGMGIVTVTQDEPRGPADAVLRGAETLFNLGHGKDKVIILMADTFINQPLPDFEDGNWVGVAAAPTKRSWCYPKMGSFYEGEVVNRRVCIGAYGVETVKELLRSARRVVPDDPDDEVPMAPLLNELGKMALKGLETWLDVGDVTSLAAARRRKFITRDFNSLELTKRGEIIKRSYNDTLQPEIKFYESLSDTESLLFPRYLGREEPGGYRIEYVDLPTLAELYLYWPGRPDMWASVLQSITRRLQSDLWVPTDGDADAWHDEMYVHKIHDRLEEWENEGGSVAWNVVEALSNFILTTGLPTMVRGHGDLNFGNILYSLGSDVIKLVDPRGEPSVDITYELAKLRYSYRDGFSAICHNLFEIENDRVIFGPQRDDDASAMDDVLKEYGDLDRITAVEATLFLSAVPLHRGPQQRALYLQGVKLAREALKW